MTRRGKTTTKFGGASFDKQFGAANVGFSRGMGDPISPTPLQVLSKTNYPVWEMWMQVHLEAYGLWEAIYSNAVPRKKGLPNVVSNIWGTIKRYRGTTRYFQDCQRDLGVLEDKTYEIRDGYYVAYKPITLSFILFMFIEMKFIHCHSCVMYAMKSMSICND